jgi:hypothetical protein
MQDGMARTLRDADRARLDARMTAVEDVIAELGGTCDRCEHR